MNEGRFWYRNNTIITCKHTVLSIISKSLEKESCQKKSKDHFRWTINKFKYYSLSINAYLRTGSHQTFDIYWQQFRLSGSKNKACPVESIFSSSSLIQILYLKAYINIHSVRIRYVNDLTTKNGDNWHK